LLSSEAQKPLKNPNEIHQFTNSQTLLELLEKKTAKLEKKKENSGNTTYNIALDVRSKLGENNTPNTTI
jgi:hypothetical protein